MIESMLCDDDQRLTFKQVTPEFESVAQTLRAKFGNTHTSGMFSLSTPQRNAVYDDDITSAIISIPVYLESLKPLSVGRKFFMNKGWVYDKVYLFVPPGGCGLPLPVGATGMGLGKLISVYGQPGDVDLTRYQCLYFMHNDHAAVETWAGQSLPQGKYSTFYAATFDTEDGNRLLRMKTYCYDQQDVFSDWDVTWLRHCKQRGLLDAIK